MDQHAIEFIIKWDLIYLGILFHPVNAYINVTLQGHFRIREIKCYDVGKIVMIKIITVDLEEKVITTKNVI